MKTNQSAKMMYDLLSEEVDISLISPYSSRFFVWGVHYLGQNGKGLEFEVLVPQANDQMYASEYDRSACSI